MAKEKQTIKRLTFTEDAAEQALLTAAEARVEAGEFATFNDVCQAALQAFLTPDSTATEQTMAPALVEPMPPMASLEPMLAALQAGQQEMNAVLQQIAAQRTPVAPPTVELATLAEHLTAIQRAQETLQAEMQHLGESLTTALEQLQTAPKPANGAQEPVAAVSESTANDLLVSQATVSRLARFLEDF